LAEALRQNVEWIREHTRLSEAAARWQARDRGTGAANDLLLRGDELAEPKHGSRGAKKMLLRSPRY
jgi:hypothetical protein